MSECQYCRGVLTDVRILQEENEKLTKALEVAERELSTAVKYLKDYGADKLENTEPEHQMFYGLGYALEQIEKIKRV